MEKKSGHRIIADIGKTKLLPRIDADERRSESEEFHHGDTEARKRKSGHRIITDIARHRKAKGRADL